MKLQLKSCFSFGLMGAIISLFISGINNVLKETFDILFTIEVSVTGFVIGFIGCLIVIKFGHVTEERLQKGLEYECSTCKNGIFETEPICSKCGYVLDLSTKQSKRKV